MAATDGLKNRRSFFCLPSWKTYHKAAQSRHDPGDILVELKLSGRRSNVPHHYECFLTGVV